MADPDTVDVLFRRLNGTVFNIIIPLSFTVGEVKVLLARKTGTPPDNQIIVFSGKKMDNDDAIFSETGVRNESALMLIEKQTLRKKPVGKKPSAHTISSAPKLPVQQVSAKAIATAAVPVPASVGDTNKSQQELPAASAPNAAPAQHSTPISAAASVSVSDTTKLQNEISSAPSLPKAASIQNSTSTSATPEVPAAAAAVATSQKAQSAKAAAAIPVVESNSSIADTASAALSDASPACANALTLHFRTLDGATHIVKTTEDATFGSIKHKFLAKLVKFRAIQIRIIFCGKIVENDKTPKDIDCRNASCLHVTRTATETILEETIPPTGELKVNCRFCHARGAAVTLRPKCNVCGGESVMLNQVSQITEGESTWSDIADCRGECFICSKKVDISWGFLCTATINGKSCPSRCPTAREMLIVYQPDESSPSLVDTLNELYGYAHAGGFEDCIDDGDIPV